MKRRTTTTVIGGFGAAALIALGMAISVPHMGAQGPGQPPPGGRIGRGPDGFGGPGGPGMGRGGRGGPGGRMGMGVDVRDLTDAQQTQIKAIREAHADALRPAMDRVQNARQALNTAVLTGTGDIRGVALEIGAAETELAFQQAQIETEIIAVLTPEQKQKMLDRQKEMDARRAEMEQRRQSRQGAPGNAK
jgi:Spy/CpxP family protein refolding chaperone